MPQAGPTDERHVATVMMPMMPVREVVRRPSALLPRVASNEYPTRVPLGYRVVLASTQPAAVQPDGANATPKEGPLLPRTEDSTPGVDQASVHFTPPCASTRRARLRRRPLEHARPQAVAQCVASPSTP